jgi:hypothetical protein
MPENALTPYTNDQLHSRACIHCGRSDGELVRAGYVRTENHPGEFLPWAVVACPEHRTGGGS